jgi:hypothetical protein
MHECYLLQVSIFSLFLILYNFKTIFDAKECNVKKTNTIKPLNIPQGKVTEVECQRCSINHKIRMQFNITDIFNFTRTI